MEYKFQQDDIGKRVLLILDLKKLDEEHFDCEEEYHNIPYESIKNYRFLIKVKDSKTRKLINTGPKKREINPVSLGKELRADEMGTIGDIVEVADNYLGIKRIVKD